VQSTDFVTGEGARGRGVALPGERVAVLLLVAAAWSCRGEAPTAPPTPDTTPPVVRVISPSYYAYDQDGDSLVDLELQWMDSGGAVNVTAVRVRSLAGANAPGGDTASLLDHWRVERRDSIGLLAHETTNYLLHGGLNHLEVTVPDTAGNVKVDTVAFVLPYASLVKTMVSGLTGYPPPIGLTLCRDDGRLYMPAGNSIVVADPDSLRLVRVVPPSQLAGQYVNTLVHPLCVPGDPILYMTSDYGLARYDRSAGQWLNKIGTYGSDGIAQSRANTDILYLGWDGAYVGIVSRSADSSVGYLVPVAGLSTSVLIWDLAALAGDAKLYAAVYHSGIWAIDPRRNVLLDSITLGTGSPTYGYGSGNGLALTRDDRLLYATAVYGIRGVHEIDTGTDQTTRTLSTEPFAAIDLALSPDEKRMFVTTQDNVPTSPSWNVLIDMGSWQIIQYFPRPRPTGEYRFDEAVVFRPDGRYIFVTHDWDIDVYLHRQ
jgi:hypothetical protein